MNPQESNEAKTLWKMFYAAESFQRARQSAEHILNNKLEKDDPLFRPLLVATYVLYAKPFTNATSVGRLTEDIIPKQHLDFHKVMMQHRNQVYAHRDADGFEVADYGTVN